jgi:hypothetical protein
MTCRHNPETQFKLEFKARTIWLLLAISTVAASLPGDSHADEFMRTHRREIREMVAASIRIETELKDPDSAANRAESSFNFECFGFIDAKFYRKYRAVIDNIDTSSIFSPAFLRKNKSDTSVLRDPIKIAYQAKYALEALVYEKDFRPPVEEYAVQYASRPDLETKCTRYLDATKMRN